MATKPTDDFTWATNASYSTGYDSGNPTKANPPGWPAVVNGLFPNLGSVIAHLNKVLNVLGQWSGWLLAGSSAGAADAHLVETDASGNTAVNDLTLNGTSITIDAPSAAVDITVTKQAGNGANAGVSATIEGQPGQDQTGASDNNNGGPVELAPGAAGTGGSGTGADGFGGAALVGTVVRNFGGSRTITEYCEDFAVIAGGSAKIMRIDLPNNSTPYLIEVTLVTITTTAWSTKGVIRQVWAVRQTDPTTMSITGPTNVYDIEDFAGGAGPYASIAVAGGAGGLDITANGAVASDVTGTAFVQVWNAGTN